MVMVMVMNDLLPPPLCNVNRPSHPEIQLFQNLTMKIHGQGHVCGQRWRSRLTFKIQRSRLWSRSNTLVTFEAWSSIDMFAFCFVAIGPLLAEIQEIPYVNLKSQGRHMLTWKVKVVMAKVKPDGHNWGLEFNQHVCFSFCGNRTIFGWDIAIPYLTLKNPGQGHDENRPKSNQVIYRPGSTIHVNKSKKLFKSYRVNKNLWPAAAAAAAYEPVQKHKVTPGIPGWLN